MEERLSFIVLTGTPEHMSRIDFLSMAENVGFYIATGISKRIFCLIVGEDANPSKIEQAHSLGIPVLSVDEFAEVANLPNK